MAFCACKIVSHLK